MNQKSFAEKRKLFFLMLPFFFLLVLPIATAQPPFQQGADTFLEGYVIEFTGIQSYENEKDIYFTNHVFNISNGRELDNNSVSCHFDLYSNTGKHLLNEIEMGWNISGHDFEYIVSGGNFTRNGEYCSMVHCNSSLYGGFEENCFEVTPTGFTGLLGFYIIIIVITLILLILGFWLKDPWIVIFGTFGLYFVGLYILLNGIDGIRNLAYTRAIAFIILGVAAYISIKTAGETIHG